MSLPVWEEWIEMEGKMQGVKVFVMSLPVWEEWIEIRAGDAAFFAENVSSRMGRVD